jgi:hypothetical protein
MIVLAGAAARPLREGVAEGLGHGAEIGAPKRSRPTGGL